MVQFAPTIGSRAAQLGRHNNFATIRAIAAVGVVFSHAHFATIVGWGTWDFVQILGFAPANHAVHAFFFLSGLLLTQSLLANRDGLQFMVARALRLVPAVVVSALVLALIVGPLTTEFGLADYFAPADLAGFFAAIVTLWDIHHPLPGVFGSNPVPFDLYELLWTLRYEYLFCAALVVALVMGMLDKPRLLLAGLVGLVAVYLANYAVPGLEKDLPALHHLVRFAAPFAFGVAAHVWRDRVPYSPVLGLGLVLIAVGLDGTGLAQLAGAVALCYAILLIGLAPTGPFATTNFLGQFSYGVYVYGFPIQQLVVHLGLGTTPLTNGLISLAIVVPLAGLSWTWVEQPLLRLKRPLAERLRALAPAAAPTEVPKAVAEPVPERRAA